MKAFNPYLVVATCMLGGVLTAAPDSSLNEFFNGFANPFTDMPKYYAWKDDMTKRLDSVFETVIPESARGRWKMEGNKPDIGDTNQFAAATWSIIHQSEKRAEQFYVLFKNKTFDKGSKQYSAIEECVESIKKQSTDGWEEPYKWTVTKINDHEAVLEGNLEGGRDRFLYRLILRGDWLITLLYEVQSRGEALAESSWNEKKEIWSERLMKVNFGQ